MIFLEFASHECNNPFYGLFKRNASAFGSPLALCPRVRARVHVRVRVRVHAQVHAPAHVHANSNSNPNSNASEPATRARPRPERARDPQPERARERQLLCVRPCQCNVHVMCTMDMMRLKLFASPKLRAHNLQ